MGFTVHGIDRELDRTLAERARKEKKRKDQLVKERLARATGQAVVPREHDDYREFLGAWSEAERRAFQKRQQDNERVRGEDWS